MFGAKVSIYSAGCGRIPGYLKDIDINSAPTISGYLFANEMRLSYKLPDEITECRNETLLSSPGSQTIRLLI